MEAFFSLITHLSLLIVLFQAAHSHTVTGNGDYGVADQWRHPNVQHLEDSIKSMAFPPEPSQPAAPAPTPGGVVSTSPDFTWPFHSKQENAPTNSPPADEGEGMPFINSNPTVPLPTGEADSVTIRPLPTSSHQDQSRVGLVQWLKPYTAEVEANIKNFSVSQKSPNPIPDLPLETKLCILEESNLQCCQDILYYNLC